MILIAEKVTEWSSSRTSTSAYSVARLSHPMIHACRNVTAQRDGRMVCLRLAVRNETSPAAVELALFGRVYIYGLKMALLFLDFISNALRGGTFLILCS